MTKKITIKLTPDQLDLACDLVYNNGAFCENDQEQKEFDKLYQVLSAAGDN